MRPADDAPRWGERRSARFAPLRIDTLRPRALHLIGEVREWEYAGEMDEGPYDGQSIWTLPHNPDDPYIGWIPDEDLIDVDVTEGVAR